MHRSGWPLWSILLISFGVIYGCSRNETIEQDPPDASFTYASTRNFPVNVQFFNTSTGGSPVNYLWDFGDGGQLSTLQNPVHMYIAGGVYPVRMIQVNTDGSRDTAIMVLNLSAAGPSGSSSRTSAASFSFSMNSSHNAVFTNNSTNASSYSWDFGDGTHSTLSNPTKTFAAGTYHVVLTATGGGGVDTCSATIGFN